MKRPSILIQNGSGRVEARQRTRDAMDRLEEQYDRFGTQKTEARVVKFNQDPLEGFDKMVILDMIRKDAKCALVAKMAKCSLDAAAVMIYNLAEQGYMTFGIAEGKFQLGVTRDGWLELGNMSNRK